MLDTKLLLFSLAVFLLLNQVHGKATLSIRMIEYKNDRALDWDGNGCDYFWAGQCDTRLKFCLGLSDGNPDDTNRCEYKTVTTGEYSETNNIKFTDNMRGPSNPVEHAFSAWPSDGVLFKVYIEDDDSGHTSHDLIDKMHYKFSAVPPVSQNIIIRGKRVYHKTELSVNFNVYCHQYYYGSTCTKYCKPQDSDQMGHYTCDPDNGNKICRPGWEDPNMNCKTFSDDCLNVDCQNGGECIDGNRKYTCKCTPGFTGTHCEININDCVSQPCGNGGTCVDGVNKYSCTCPEGFLGEHCETNINECESEPCQNNGTCVDGPNEYRCTCTEGYLGENCEFHICTVQNECENGGSCYVKENLTTGCFCTPDFTGSKCSVEKCDLIDCKNGGTCDMGKCHCKYAYFGNDCANAWCDVMVCLNAASCENKTCICQEGFTGNHCETEINLCESNPCRNEGTCIKEFNGYECMCMPDYNGTHCEDYLEPETTASPGTDEYTHIPEQPTAQPIKDVHSETFWFAGVVLPICILIAAFVGFVAYCCRRRKEPVQYFTSEDYPPSFDNPVYGQTQVPPGGTSNLGNGVAPSSIPVTKKPL